MNRNYIGIASIGGLSLAGSLPVLGQTQLTPYPDPILEPASPRAWDEHLVFLPDVVVHDGVFYMFYTGWNFDFVSAIGLATSTDGIQFEKHPGNPILISDGEGWDSGGVGDPTVVFDDGQWIMYFSGAPDSSPGAYVGRATAPTAAGPWTRDPPFDPVLGVGAATEWDGGFLVPESILRTATAYRLYYSAGQNFFSGLPRRSGLATSSDGRVWTKYNDTGTPAPPFADSDPILPPGAAGSWDSLFSWTPSLAVSACRWSLYFGGFNGSGSESIGYASSRDGQSWTRHVQNPVLTPNDAPWAAAILPGAAVVHESTYFLYFWGAQSFPFDARIGVATAPLDGDSNANGVPDECECPADLNQSGAVDLQDLAILLSNFGSTTPGPEDGDLNGDGVVSLQDLAILLSAFGVVCP